MTAIEFRDVSARIGRAEIVSGVSFSSADARLIALIGPNGAGKSTLLRAIAGLAPGGGAVERGGRVLAKRDIAYLPQAFAVQSDLSVLETILLGRHERLGLRIPPGEAAEASALLARLGLAALERRRMRTLSGGQQQLALLAQRLFRNPALLLLDEPTSALDLKHQIDALRMLAAHVAQTGAVAVLAIHDINLALRFAERVVAIADGRLIACGAPDAVATPELIERVYGLPVDVLTDRAGRRAIVPREGVDASYSVSSL